VKNLKKLSLIGLVSLLNCSSEKSKQSIETEIISLPKPADCVRVERIFETYCYVGSGCVYKIECRNSDGDMLLYQSNFIKDNEKPYWQKKVIIK